LLLRQARATQAAYRMFLTDAIGAGELAPHAQAGGLARAVETTVSGSLMTWAVYREGPATDWVERDVRAVLGPFLVGRVGRGARTPRGRRRGPGR
jgi:hypothetical protein